MNSTSAVPSDLAAWIDRIRGRDMPVFARTVDALRRIVGDERASASALSQVILKDAPMTTKVLRLANSAYFNHAHQGINTVSRAIVVLGFDPVAQLALSVALIDALLGGGVRCRVHREMARSFHAAVQARWAIQRRGESLGEEVFIAALLSRVGEMAFWCFGGEQAQALERCMSQGGVREEEAQQMVLGFSLRHLSAGLVREWRLGSLAAAAIEGDVRSRGPERAVVIGERLARAAEEGWDSAAARRAIREAADYLALPPSAVSAEVVANADEAARVAAFFGAPEAGRAIPRGAPFTAAPEPEAAAVPAAPDAALQLRILQDLAAMSLERVAIADILQLAAEGVLRGVGCERVVVALLTPDRLHLQGKMGLGAGGEALCARFAFSMDGDPDDVVDDAIDSGKACWVNPARVERGGTERLLAVTASESGFVVPFGSATRRIGVLYADRNGRLLDDESWRAVQHFALQASLAVALCAADGGSG
ncbi:HDOD domain-containing protein [Zoogloea sp.]|uniref:HDOD domain-containing protein n=1 Tax=Zoogloea sp. TaxID=49181 RepID=UPI0035B4DFA6